ncbi:MAG: NAD-dependent epimerase/dehydratase family protein [Candidatus Micrarchaeia archaeon]
MQLEKTIPKQVQKTSPGSILVTGGAGRLGKRLIEECISKGITVRALVKDKEDAMSLPYGTIPYIGDITSRDIVFDACKGVDTVYHLAAIVSQRDGGQKEIIRVNAEGTKLIMEAADIGGAKRIILTSTVDVYGSKRKDPLTEESELKPNDIYGHSKMLAEKQITSFSGNISYTILRLATIYGEEYKHSFFKIFDMINSDKAYLIGNGKNNLCLINIKDVLNALLLVRESKVAANKIYNLTDGMSYTQEQLFSLACTLLGKKEKLKHINEFMARLLSKKAGITIDDLRFITSNRVVSIEKISKELEFKPKVDIKTGASELIKLYKMHKGVLNGT